MTTKFYFLLTILSTLFICKSEAQTVFTSYQQFKDTLNVLTTLSDVSARNARLTKFWNDLKSQNQIPFKKGNQAAFLYRGSAAKVEVAGDFTEGWGKAFSFTKAGLSDVWIYETTFPADARLDYKLIVGGNWILDPNNPFVQMSGFGNNSEIRMPDYVPSEWVKLKSGISRGKFGSNIKITSSNLGYSVNYRVYTPAGYDTLSNLPVIYVTDGHEYANDLMGSMIIVLDNMIAMKKMNPVIAVFIDPRNTSTGDNRRMTEYNCNNKFVSFVCDELVPAIDGAFKSNTAPESRAILGTSMGGLNSAWFGGTRSDKFRLIGINSPAFWYNSAVYNPFKGDKLPLKLFMSTGVIYDTQTEARLMESTYFKGKGYYYTYVEVNEGHSWGNWRALLDDALLFFWPYDSQVSVESKFEKPSRLTVSAYPNPFNPVTTIQIFTTSSGLATFEVLNVLGQRVQQSNSLMLSSGENKLTFSGSDLPSGIYLVRVKQNQSESVVKLNLLK